MRELWLYLRCVFHNEVTYSSSCVGMFAFTVSSITYEFSMLWFTIALAITVVCALVFLLSGAALNTFYHYAVTAAAIGGSAGSRGPVQLSPAMRPAERTGAQLACKDLSVSYT